MAAETSALPEFLRTFGDLVDYIQINNRSGATAGGEVAMRQTALRALRKLYELGNGKWNHHFTEHRVNLSAEYETGTITYDHTGGASERLLTIADGTWPSWSKYGRVEIGDYIYDVEDYIDTSNITLSATLNPGADVAAGTSFRIFRSWYPLPDDMWSVGEVYVEDGGWRTFYIHPSDWVWQDRYWQDSGRTWGWTILPDKDRRGIFSVVVEPAPDTAEPLGFMYRRTPRQMRWTGKEATARLTNISVSATDTTVTTASALPSSMVGSILRLSVDSNYPTGFSGDNPFTEQHEIASISGTTVTLKSKIQAAHSSVNAIVSCPEDVSENMQSATDAWMDYFHGKAAKLKDYEIKRLYAEALSATRVALENESRTVRASSPRYFILDREWAMRQADVGDA